MDSGFLAFLGIAAVVIVTPGSDTALTVRNTLGGGRPSGVGTAFGVAVGQAVWTLATSAGIAALLVAGLGEADVQLQIDFADGDFGPR